MSAIAPPFTLTRSKSGRHTVSQHSSTDANASLTSNRSMSAIVIPAAPSTRSVVKPHG